MDDKWIKTNWYCVRHALVPYSVHNGTFYGAQDVDCTPDDELSQWNRQHLPMDDNVVITSALKRTHQTADAIGLTDYKKYAELNEQHFGDWENKPFDEIHKETDKTFWYAPAENRIPNGESFADLYNRVNAKMTEITAENSGKNIISVTHGGTIRAMCAVALNLNLDDALNLTIDNQSISLLEHFYNTETNEQGKWRIRYINKLPNEGIGI